MNWLFRYSGFALAMVAIGVAAQDQDKPATPAEQYQALLKEFQGAAATYFQSTNETVRQAMVARADKATVRLLELVEKNPKEPFALEALTQVVTQEYWLNNHTSHPGWGKESPQARAIVLLLRDHVQSDQLVETCKRVNFGFRQECETFLRTVLAKNPHRDVQGAACLRLAQLLAGRVEKLELLKEQPELARRYESLFGKDYIEALQRQDRAKVMKEAEALYERASDTYGDVTLPYNETVGEVARTDLFEIRRLTIGKIAPALEGSDQDGRPFRLSDYRGKVVLLYFWSEY
jgi:AhpC/TSA family protein